jgi:hypothetical protein
MNVIKNGTTYYLSYLNSSSIEDSWPGSGPSEALRFRNISQSAYRRVAIGYSWHPQAFGLKINGKYVLKRSSDIFGTAGSGSLNEMCGYHSYWDIPISRRTYGTDLPRSFSSYTHYNKTAFSESKSGSLNTHIYYMSGNYVLNGYYRFPIKLNNHDNYNSKSYDITGYLKLSGTTINSKRLTGTVTAGGYKTIVFSNSFFTSSSSFSEVSFYISNSNSSSYIYWTPVSHTVSTNYYRFTD